MKKTNPILLAIILIVIGVSVRAIDFAVDPAFNPTFVFPDFNVDTSIADVVVQADGKIVVGGTFTKVNGETIYYIARLNSDGSRDTTFNSPIVPASGFLNYVTGIVPLPDGKFVVSGQFKIGNAFASYVKINSDGSIDGSMPNYAFLSPNNLTPLPDGKFLACSGRLINNETYWIAHRLNADGSVDPTFRITFSQGVCNDVKLQPDGKILMSGVFQTPNNFYFEPIQRFNPDGSRDTTFNLQTSSATGAKFSLLPDGRILASYGQGSGVYTKRFSPDGSIDADFHNCSAQAFLPLSNGNVLMSGCRKWSTGLLYQFANMLPSGSIDPSLDWVNFNGNAGGFRAAPDGKFYVFGNFTSVDGMTRAKIVRLMPYTAPVKAKFDFDGDGSSDISVFRRSDRYWYLKQSTSGAVYTQWGLSTDVPVAADYDFDNKTDVAVFRDSSWLAFGSSFGYTWVVHGQAGDKPMIGDFNNDGKSDWAVRRITSGVVNWFISRGGAAWQVPVDTMNITDELQDDKPVVGDFDGDHRDEIGAFRDGTWRTRDFGSGAPTSSFRWGSAGDIPVPADYDGDGQTDYAVFRPSTGVWWINQSTQGVFVARFGLQGDIPVPADYDGDGKVDIAIFRDGQWWQYLSSTSSASVVNWGTAGDIPIPAQNQ